MTSTMKSEPERSTVNMLTSLGGSASRGGTGGIEAFASIVC